MPIHASTDNWKGSTDGHLPKPRLLFLRMGLAIKKTKTYLCFSFRLQHMQQMKMRRRRRRINIIAPATAPPIITSSCSGLSVGVMVLMVVGVVLQSDFTPKLSITTSHLELSVRLFP